MSSIFFALTMLLLFGVCFSSQRTHVLSMLISLEGAMLSLLSYYYFFSAGVLSSSSLFLLLLTFAACEAALGLSVLVSFMRLHGSDLVGAFSTAKW
uniref:NADH dehydrogenase subunit 4L n=1 Tax=Melampus sincaporensis TaxID=1628046 RepID=UPI003002427B|nr:NADH dehydrogenase subunit 4L [Melampus sincaporensis]